MKSIIKIVSIIAIAASIIWISFYLSQLMENRKSTEQVRELYVELSTENMESSNEPEPTIETTEEPEQSEEPVNSDIIIKDTTDYFTDLRKNPNSELLSLNSDFIGWVKVGGTEVDYPVVKHNDNEFYLDKDFYKEKNIAGSIYMDYRNFGNTLDGHIIIYGHNMKNGTMFNSLNDFKDENFFEANRAITFSNLYNTYKYEIFSVYWVSANDYELEVDFKNNNIYEYYNLLREKSLFQRELEADDITQIITLATCSYEVDNGRLMVHGILVPE
jgi:sortase B